MKLLKTTTDGTASQKSMEIHLKLDNYQLNRISFDTCGATWPEFWAIGLSFLGLFAFLIMWPPRPCGGSRPQLSPFLVYFSLNGNALFASIFYPIPKCKSFCNEP